jgi:hypothetical protein
MSVVKAKIVVSTWEPRSEEEVCAAGAYIMASGADEHPTVTRIKHGLVTWEFPNAAELAKRDALTKSYAK